MNKKVLIVPLMVLTASVLAACSTSTVVARPDWQDQKIIDGIDVKDNKMKVIYDAIKGLGDTNANVLNKVLYDISVKNIGDYYDKENGLGQFIDKDFASVDKEKLKTFIQNHSIYKTKETHLIKKDGTKIELKEYDDNYLHVSFNMIKNQLDEIKENIAEKLYDEIKGGSYSIDNVFYEEKFLMNLRKNMYNVDKLEAGQYLGGVLLPRKHKTDKETEAELESWETYINKYLHYTVKAGTKENIYADYIKNKIVPDIYRTYLIQTFVKEQRYSNVSRSYARKVKTITIAQGNTEIKSKIYNLLKNFATSKIVSSEFTNFDLLEEAMKGFVGTDDTEGSTHKMLVDAGFVTIKDSSGAELVWKTKDTIGGTEIKTHVFKGTKLGDLIEKLQKVYKLTNGTTTAEVKDYSVTMTLLKNPNADAYKDLTNSGAYTIEEGLKLKEREIHLSSYTKEGWFLKNGGLSDLDSTIRERLFSIRTSSLVDEATESSYSDGDYVRNFKDKYFLTTKIPQTATLADYIILNDNKNYSIIQVEEAISTSKMTDSSNNASYMYKKAGENEFTSINAMNKIIYDVVKASSSGDTYKKNANQYYLMISNILFYDQSVYDYFKSQYPDLFK